MKKILPVVCALLLIAGLLAIDLFVTDGKILSDYQNAYYTGEKATGYALGSQQYGGILALAALAALLVANALVARKSGVDARGGLLFGAAAVWLGLVLSRVFYCATEFSFYSMDGAGLPAVWRVYEGGMSMAGAVVGGVLAMILTARATKNDQWLNAAAALPLFMCFARLGERFTHTGYGDYAAVASVFTFADEYGDPIINVWLIEALIAFAVLIALVAFVLRGRGRPADTLLLFLLLYGTAQLVAESLKFDGQMCWGFVKAQQLYAMLMAAAAVIVFGARAKKALLAVLVSLAAAGAFVLLGFALDRWDVPALTLYLAFVAVQALYILFGLFLYNKGKKASA